MKKILSKDNTKYKYSLKPFYKFLGIRDINHCDFSGMWSRTNDDKEIIVPLGKDKNINLSEKSGCNILVMDSFDLRKEAFMETFTLALTSLYSPKKIKLYIIDSSQIMFRLNHLKLPHIKKYNPFIHYDEKNKKEIMDFIINEIDNRKKLFKDIGVDSYDAYLEYCGKFNVDNIVPRIVFIIDIVTVFDNGDIFYKDNSLFKDFKTVGFNILATLQLRNLKTLFTEKYDITNCITFSAKKTNKNAIYNKLINRRTHVVCHIKGKKLDYNCKLPVIASTVSAFEHKELNLFVKKMIEAYDNL